MKKIRWMPILIVIVIGIALAVLILTTDKKLPDIRYALGNIEKEAATSSAVSGEKKSGNEDEPVRGLHGGKLFTKDDFAVELTIYEKGVPPQFRLYLYSNGRALPPTDAEVTITLTRLGAPAQLFRFMPEGEYLIGDQVVEEPHSFDVVITAEREGKVYRWGDSQVEARVEISDEMLKKIGVEVQTAGPALIKTTLKLLGEIVFNPERIVQVVPRLQGVVVAVNYEPGQTVQKGDVLAVIESQMLADLQSQFLAAQRRLALAQTVHDREKQLWEEKVSAKQDYLAAGLALSEAQIDFDLAAEKLRALGVKPEVRIQKKALTRYEIRAPISGLIISRAMALGAALKDDVTIFTVADMSTVWTSITVYPKDLHVIRIGQKASVKATAFDVEGEGVVTYVTPLIGGQTRTATARVVLDNKDGRWHPGMFVNIELVSEEIEVPVAVSAQAIQMYRDWTVVFGRYGSYFEARPVELGRSDEKMVEVLNGITAGEQYASGNSFAIKADMDKTGATHDH